MPEMLPMKAYFDLFHTVDQEEIDGQGHVHNLRYLQWTLWAAREHSEACGWDTQQGLEQGLGWVVRGHDVVYRAAAFAGDDLIVRTWVSELSSYASKRKYVVYRPSDDVTLTRVETRWVFVDLNRRKAIKIPNRLHDNMTVCASPPTAPWPLRGD